jgi:hypothetical protein
VLASVVGYFSYRYAKPEVAAVGADAMADVAKLEADAKAIEAEAKTI